jgi:hypothetical protein
MADIKWSFQAAIPGGPAISIAQPNIAVQAYDVAAATIAASGGSADVSVQPSSSVGDVVFVVISSDQYDAGLTYKVDGGAVHALDAPHVLLGAGAVGMINGGPPPQKLTFTNTLTKDANVQVVTGRKNP